MMETKVTLESKLNMGFDVDWQSEIMPAILKACEESGADMQQVISQMPTLEPAIRQMSRVWINSMVQARCVAARECLEIVEVIKEQVYTREAIRALDKVAAGIRKVVLEEE